MVPPPRRETHHAPPPGQKNNLRSEGKKEKRKIPLNEGGKGGASAAARSARTLPRSGTAERMMGCFAGHGASASRDEDSKNLLPVRRRSLQSRSTPRRGASCARTLHARPPCTSRAAPGRAAAFARRVAPREVEHRFTLRRQARPSMAARGKPRFRGGKRPRRPALLSCRFAPQKKKGEQGKSLLPPKQACSLPTCQGQAASGGASGRALDTSSRRYAHA